MGIISVALHEARAAFDIARATFDRVSFDLIYARTGQTPSAWQAELTEALEMAVDHLSLYQLTIEPGTRFAQLHAAGKLSIPEPGPAADMYQITQDLTTAAGLPAYEISNHARPGAQSRHNLVYWRLGDYAGIGPGAHGRISGPANTQAIETHRDPATWLTRTQAQGHGIAAAAPVPRQDRATEYLMMAMRLDEGADVARYARMANAPLAPERIEDLVRSGHVNRDGDMLCATPAGRIVLNAVLGELLT